MMPLAREYFASTFNRFLLGSLFVATAVVVAAGMASSSSGEGKPIFIIAGVIGILNLFRLNIFALKRCKLGYQRLAIALMPLAAVTTFALLRTSHFYRYGFRDAGDLIIGLIWIGGAAGLAGSAVVVSAWIVEGFSN